RNRCIRCGAFYDLADFMKLRDEDGIPRCTRDGGAIKPEVVLYEEPLDETVIDNAIDAISRADTMVIVGTSLVVYPAASFVRYFRGKHLILINKSETDIDGRAELAIHDDAALVSEQVETILKAM
ncbi:MAG: NAD-dependent protein deacylase, partial [Clostridia bacterium]|nr:NAD-dependent protein deacylase [Clostridia bacterium]